MSARETTTFAHRLLVATAALGCIAFPRVRKQRGGAAQGALLVGAATLGLLGLAADSPTFWPLATFTATVPWLLWRGRPAFPPALTLPVSLLATTLVMHAVFFGEDRYHVVVTPVFALLAAAALRESEAVGRAPSFSETS